MKKLSKSEKCLIILMTFLLIICLISFFFFREIEEAHRGFLSVEVLRKIGFYDESYTKYQGYWYSNGHLHPLYVATLEFFYQNYVVDSILIIVGIIYALIKRNNDKNISFSYIFVAFSSLIFLIDFVGFSISTYYSIVSNWTYPALQTFIIYMLKMIFFICFFVFCFKTRKNKKVLESL